LRIVFINAYTRDMLLVVAVPQAEVDVLDVDAVLLGGRADAGLLVQVAAAT
jgi:hypothetical protein